MDEVMLAQAGLPPLADRGKRLGDVFTDVDADIFHQSPHIYPEVSDAVLDELRSVLYSSLSRADQRRKAEQYLRGLLFAVGRKSMRNIATLAGGGAAEQSLHHFISSSTWDWRPMRRALAQLLERTRPPQAWVLQPLLIPKAGEHSVGVQRQFVPELGQMMNGQQAFGLWLASSEFAAPVDWRLFLPRTWISDETGRRGDIPDRVPEETVEECTISTVLDSAHGLGLVPRPVLLDTRAIDFAMAARRLQDAGLSFAGRVRASMRLLVADPALPGYGSGALPAQRVLESVRGLRQPVVHTDPDTGMTRTSLAVTIQVALPPAGLPPAGRPHVAQPGGRALRHGARRPGGARTFLLMAEWEDPGRPPTRIWLTDMISAPCAALLRMTKLAHRVSGDLAKVGDQVGLRHFTGRSFQGWHRHMTLASIAHAARMLDVADWRTALPVPVACS